jgi:formylglycine-generating enzyme required for sulfatase activity
MPAEQKCIRLFISYSRRDQELRAELDKQLSPLKRSGIIHVWHDRQIDPGQDWDLEIKRNLEEADIILLLISADFMASDYAWSEEMERALARHKAGEARVIPVILHPCEWELAPFAKIQALPRDAKAVTKWENRAEALADIARGVRIVAQDIAKNPLKRPVAPTPEEPEVAPRVRERQQAIVSTRTEPSAEQIQPKEIRTNPIDGQPYVWIPPGAFEMGCSEGDGDCEDDEKPRHTVRITKGFWLGQTPVTAGAYRRFVKATKRRAPDKPDFQQTDEHPVVNVSWQDAVAYCQWAGGRLPTEAEWEYAARAGSTAARYGPIDEIAWYADNSGAKTHPVGQMKPNSWGLYDMLGNVLEWTADGYAKDYYRRSPERDPKGPDPPGDLRVLRGGSWGYGPWVVRASYRYRVEPEGRVGYIGFRCAREVTP